MIAKPNAGAPPDEDVLIVELDERLEFAAGLVESEDRVDANVCQANPSACNPTDFNCGPGNGNVQACC